MISRFPPISSDDQPISSDDRQVGCETPTAPLSADEQFTVVVPLVADNPLTGAEFCSYLEWVSSVAELIIVDGSSDEVFRQHDLGWGSYTRHVPPAMQTPMGKVGNVMTGVFLASHDRIVIADDDVRFGQELFDLVRRLDAAEVVRPQNFFWPLPWHAVWDSGRSLLNRLWGGDWPGTLALRRSVLLAAGGYAGDVLFENYELTRTIEAAGGRHAHARDLFVRRLPPPTRHFLSQRIRQAYDEMARPVRLALFLPLVPSALVLCVARRWGVLRSATLLAMALVVGAAEVGRRLDGAQRVFPFRCSVAAPLWVLERAACVWMALFARARGGVRYRGRRFARAALPPAQRQHRVHRALIAADSWEALRPPSNRISAVWRSSAKA